MKTEWLPIYIILGYIAFRLLMNFSYPILVFIHELGHALPAKCFKKTNVRIQIGAGALRFKCMFSGIAISIHRDQTNTGITIYEGMPETLVQAGWIIMLAPLLNLLLAIALTFLFALNPPLITVFILSAVWLANFHITFSALWPIRNPKSDVSSFIRTCQKIHRKA